jgi:hypothetical protein
MCKKTSEPTRRGLLNRGLLPLESNSEDQPLSRSGHWFHQGRNIVVPLDDGAQPSEELNDVTANSFQPPKGVIDPRIDVGAQKALLRMFKGGQGARADATGMLAAVKSSQLAGIFGDDLLVVVKLAQGLGTYRWLLVSKGEDAALVLDPADPLTALATIIFRGDTQDIRSISSLL